MLELAPVPSRGAALFEHLVRLPMFVRQDPHNKIVVPLISYKSAFSFDAFPNKTAFFITTNRSFIVFKYSDIYAMKPELSECIVEHEVCDFSTKAFAPVVGLEYSNGVTRLFFMRDCRMKKRSSYATAIGGYCPI